MAVTELSVGHAKAGTVTPELKGIMANASKVLDAWLAKTFPSSSGINRARAIFEQVEDPAKFLITLLWDSVQAHTQWHTDPENKHTVEGLREHVDIPQTVVRHVDGSLFAGPAPEGITNMLDAPVISLGRTYIPADNKPAADAKIKEIAASLQDFSSPHDTRWAWAVDPKDEKMQEFVIVSGWDSIEAHLAFKKHPSYAKWQEFLDLADSTEYVHYKRFL
jgi:heme-degrading monooxygenase HmoA